MKKYWAQPHRIFPFLLLPIVFICVSCGGGGATSTPTPPGGNPPPSGGGNPSSTPVSLSAISPSNAMVGVPQGTIVLTGRNFTTSSKVLLDGVQINSRFISAFSMEADLPTEVFGREQDHSVQVSDPANGISNTLIYEVYKPKPGPSQFIGQTSFFPDQRIPGVGTLADLNNDGRSDLVLVDVPWLSPTATLMARFGQPDGTFSSALSPGVHLSKGAPQFFLPADVNGDGSVDLILIYSNAYQVLLNNGSATFTVGGEGSLPAESYGQAVTGDFNGDGRTDFITDTGENQTFAIQFGNGNGTFAPSKLIGTAESRPKRAIACDLNGDGVTDLIYGIPGSYPNIPPRIETLLFGKDGNATQTALVDLAPYVGPFTVADFNDNGVPDLFVIDSAGQGRTFLGYGNGSFGPPAGQVAASDNFLSTAPLVTGDFDNDGYVDIATRLALVGPDTILFLWGKGNGSFSGQLILSDQSFYLTTGDVNGDTIPDIFSTGDFAYPSVILGRKDRNFPSAKAIWPGVRSTLSAGNVYGDGYNDILVSGSGDCVGGEGVLGSIYHILPNGAPSLRGNTPACTSVLADLDGDGLADLVGVNAGTIFIWKGDGTGVFQTPVTETAVFGYQVIEDYAFRDMDRDGHTDIVVTGGILYGKGNLKFDVFTLPDGARNRLLVGDFDGDGNSDIAGEVLFFGAGGRSFTVSSGVPLDFWNGYASNPAVGDVNGDGKDDVVFGSSTSYLVHVVGATRETWYSHGVLAVPGYSPLVRSVSLADFNDDGRLDIAVGTSPFDDVVLFTNQSSGQYLMTSYTIGVNPTYSIAADFNHDGKIDLAFRNYEYMFKPPTVSVLLHK